MDSFEAALKVVSNSTHPYSALADYIITSTVSVKRPLWAKTLFVGNIFADILLLSLALATCVIRTRDGNFTLGCITRDYIVRPNYAICFAIGCIGYSIMSIIEIAAWFAAEHMNDAKTTRGRVVLVAGKYIFLWLGCWCFTWSSAGYYICAKWRPPWLPQHREKNLPSMVVWALNSTFIISALIAITLPLVTFGLVEVHVHYLLGLLFSGASHLRRLDRHHVVEFDVLTALRVLKPLFSIGPLLDTMVNLMRLGTLVWLGIVLLLVAVQMIFVYLSISQRRSLGATETIWETCKKTILNKPGDANRSTKSSLVNHLQEQNLILILSAAIFFVAGIFVPFLLWVYYNVDIGNLITVRLELMTNMITSSVVVVSAVILSIGTLKQTLRLSRLRAHSNDPTVCSVDELTRSGESRKQKSINNITERPCCTKPVDDPKSLDLSRPTLSIISEASYESDIKHRDLSTKVSGHISMAVEHQVKQVNEVYSTYPSDV
ncbi:hypothetical protein DFH28DRAFT_1216970 [Melampsora americana]|nr:hypothetical protein DFH28DRAFT_1216970 [Melampsora americana]